MTDGAIVYKYRGRRSGAHLIGVPARDLTQADVDTLEPSVRADLEAHAAAAGDAYRAIEPEPEAPAKPRRNREPGDVVPVGGE